MIKESGAFKAGTKGSQTIPQILQFGERILSIPGKKGLNAFSNTELANVLKERGITDVVLAGVVCSICIDSTGRSAFEQGYRVSILSDCISGRTIMEQNFYLTEIFPLYANVLSYNELINSFKISNIS